MGIYNIYSYNNAADDDSPRVVVELDENDTEIVSVVSSDPERQEDDESIIRGYVEKGVSPLDALSMYAGQYGQVWPEGADSAAAGTGESDAVLSAADEVDNSIDPSLGADRIFSGDIMALVDDDGIVASLFKASEDGSAAVRVGQEWKPLSDMSVLDGLSFVGVSEGSVDVYDEHESSGNLVPIKFYAPSPGGPYWREVVEYEDSEDDELRPEEAVTAALVVNSASDLDNAISAALLNSDLRWYVERRASALGIEVDFPWSEG